MADTLEQPEGNTTPIPRIKPLNARALQADQVSVAVNRGLMGNPAEAAKRKEYSKELGVEPHEIGDLNEAKAAVIKKRSQMDRLIETNPGLARYLLNNPITPELASEDLPALHKIARAWRRTALDPIVQVFGKGSSMLAQGAVGAADIATRFVPGKKQDLGKTLEDAGFKFKELDQILEGMLSPEQQLANMKRAEQKTFTGALEAMVESPSSATDMVLSSLLPMAGGGVLGGVLKKVAPGASAAVAAALGESLVITGGLQEKIRQESKTGTTTEAQKSIATLAGTAAGGVSAVSNVIARKLGLPDIDAYIASGGLKNALTASGVPPSLAKVTLGGAITEGVLEEMPQSVIEQFAENVALGKQWDNGLGAAAAQGLVAGSLTQLGFSPMMIRDAQNTIEDNISRERHKAASDALQKTFKAMRAEGTRDMLAKVGDAVSESNLRNLSTDAFAEFVDHMTEDSDVDAIYVPVEKLDEVLLQSGMTESEIAEKMPEVADNIRIARATKGDVRIPVKDYLVNFAGTPTEKSLLDHVKIDPEGMTFAESQEFMQSQQAEFAEQAQQIIAADEPVLSAEEYAKQPVEGKTYKQYLQEHPDQNAVIAADSKNVEKVIVGELNKAGRFNREANAVYAVPFREFFRTAAIRETRSTGRLVTPSDIYERYPLKYQMRGETPTATPDTLTQPVTTATPEDFKTENIQNILKNGNWMIVAATNPNASTLTDAENEKLHAKLLADLDARGFKYEVVYGRYPGDDAEMPSVLVYDVDNATARDFANRYDQDSVLVRDGFIYRDGQVKPHLGNVTTYSDTASAFSAGGYTRVPSTGAIFSVDFDWDASDRYAPGADFYAQPTIQKPGSMTLVGVRYSHEKRTVFEGTRYGGGLTGAERDRVLYGANTDNNIKTRVDFYTDTGNGVTPESGLGGVKHEVLLTDIYDASVNPLNFSYPPTWDGGNTFEQQVIANGFKGYFVNQGKQGRVVLLGEAARAVQVPTSEQLEEQKHEQRRRSGFLSAATRAYQGTREADGSLKGLPRQVGGFNAAHYRKAEEVTRKYMADAGLPYNPPSQYVTVDPERARRIASAFDAMKHDPQDPLVKEAYAALAAETIAQYKAVLDSGLVIEFIDFSKTGDPYEGNPRKMTEDVINNNHMWVFSTREGFGSDAAFDPTDNPLLAETEFEISGQKALVNDLFRVVHDYFGHVKEGVGFRASGEENAWRAHMSMFSPLAGRALTTETRGQNSWVNFGPYAEHNKTASGADTHYADQKIGLLPEWVSADGVNDSVGTEGYQQSARRLMLKTENLKKYGLKPGGKYTTREVVAALEARQRDKYGIIEKGDYSEEAINKISSWIAEEVRFEMSNPDNSGLGWYSWKYQRALDIMGEKYPELLTDKNARSTFTALLAITSDGNRPSINTILADVAYAEYRETGRFGSLEGKTARTNIPVVISRLQSLYDEFGGDVEKVHQYLMSEKTLGELKREAEAAGKTLSSPYEVSTMLPMAALEFGPKLGAFYANLMGSHGYLTMDRWWSRTFNRYRGLLLTAPTKEGLNTFRNLIDQPELSDDEVVSAVVPFAERLGARKFKTRLAQLVGKSEPSKKADAEKWMKIAREKAGDAFEELLAEHNIERAANTIYKAAFISIEDAPFGARDRTFMINATKKARRKLKATGLDISVSDIQAVLWFFEKKLYGELGTKFSGTVSYEDTARKIISGQLTTADLGSEDDGAIDGVDEEEVSVGDEAYTDEGDYQQSSFYSALEREIGGLNKIANKEGAVKPDQAIKWIEARQKEGKFKKEEVEAVGILDWLQTRTGDVKVAAIEDFVRQNGVQLEVVFVGEEIDEDRIYDMAREAFDNNFDVRDSSFYEDSVYDATLDTARKMLEDPEHSVWELYGENWHDTEELESYSRSDVSELAHRLRELLPIEEIIGSELEREAYEYAYDAAWESYSDSYLEDAREYLFAEGEAYLAEYDDYQLDNGDNYREILFRLPHLDLRGGFDAPHFRKDLSSNLIAHARINERVADVYTPEEQAQVDAFKKHRAEWVAGNNTQEVKALFAAKYKSYEDLRAAANGRIITPELEAEDPVLAEAADRDRRLTAEVKALQETRRAAEPKRPAVKPKRERVLFVEEVQSDWAQQGRDFGFILKNPPKLTAEELEYEAIIARISSSENSDQNRLAGKPPTKEEQERLEELRARNVDKSYKKKTKPEINAAPFVTDTQAWVTLVTKRLLRYAAENGFTRISWTTGAQQAERYRTALLAQVDEIRYTKNKYGTYSFELYKKGSPSNQRIWEDNVSADRIMAVFGKDIGEKIINSPVTEGDDVHVLAADNLTVGGSGMKDFYDKLLPSVVSKVTKSLGGSGKVELIDFTGKGEVYDDKIGIQQSIAITPAMVEKIMSGLPLFKGERGSFNPNTFITTLTDGSDKSTVIHEGGHFYLEALADMASRPDAPQQVKDDFRKTLDWFGIKGDNLEDAWRTMTLEQKRPFHEQWAQSFERYILEGKAPTVEMQPVFARFRAWMISVYKSIKEFLKQNPLAGKLNDDVRAIFDRLLATEEKIAEMERARSMMPLFASADQAGVTQAKFEAYLAEGQAATDEAVSQLAARSLRDMKWASGARDKALRQLQQEAKAKRRALTEEVAAEVAQEPITQARNFLLRGIITGDDGVKTKAPTTFKLDRGAINELYPGIDLTRIEKMVSDAGMTPDAASQMFGFSSGQELIDALINEESTTDKIQGLVDQRMLERYGDLVDDKAIEAAADKAIHNRVRAKFLATGLAMLKGQPGTAKDLNKAARLAAEGALSAKRVRDITPGQYAAAERRANAEALKRVKENPASAIEAQRAALLNNHMARIARDIREEVEAGLRYVKKFDKKELRKLLGPDYVEQIDDLLSGFDFRKGTSLAQIDKMQSLRDWIEDQEAEGLDPAIDLDLVEALKTKSYKEMTIEEFRSLIDAIKQIEHLGRLKNKLLTAKDQKEFRATVDEAEQSIRDNANRTVAERETPSDVFGKVGKWVRQMFASHRKFNSVIREMDGFKNAGVMWRILARPMNEAGDREVEMRQQAAEQIAKLFGMLEKKDTVPGNLYSKKRLVPGTNISMTQEQRIMFGMNWGNEGNRQRLIDGGLTGRKALSAQEAQAILDTITKEEWDFIQGVLDYIGSYKDQIAALEKQLTGIEPKWIEISPIVTKFGTYRGGYFPAKYDADLSTRSEVLEAVNDSRMGMKGAFGAAATRNGYAKERSKQVIGRPILLSFNVISQHVSEVTHRLAWQPWLVDANRLLRALDAPIREHYGTEILRELRNTVLDIATGDVGAKNAMEAAINHLRTGSTIVGMGWRVTTALLQPSGLAQSWTRLGSRWATAGVARYLKNPLEAGRFVDEKSSLMRNRGITMQREINEVLNTLRSGDKVSAVTGSYFTMIGKMQRTVDIPTWIGAYEKHLHELGYEAAGGEDERQRMENEAIAIADQTVIDTQSGGQIKDLASIQRGSPVQKLFTNFYSYFSATYNLNVETVRRTDLRDPASVGLMAVDLLLLNAAPVLFAVALKNMMKGGCDWGDTECLVEKVAQEQISFLMGQMVVLREVAVAGQAVIGGDAYGYQGPAGLRFFSDLYKLGTQVEQGDADFAAFKAANSVAGALFHYPAGQINSTLDGILAIEDGRVEGVSILPALIAGAPKE